jgi:8-oxo-dGTP diphosphatase
MSVHEQRRKETEEAGPALRAGNPSVIQEYLSFPRAKWIVRSRRLSSSAFARVSGRIRRGLRYGVAVRIEDARHRILLVRMNPKTAWTSNWTTPGGGAEPGEPPRRAILREVEEETGVRIHALQLWKVYHESLRSPKGGSVEWDFLQYTARWRSGVPRSRVPSEIIEVRWFARLPSNTEFRTDWLRHARA